MGKSQKLEYMKNFKTPQEQFWYTKFGDEYSKRVVGDRIVLNNISLFSRALRATGKLNSAVELGCNIGLNLRALNQINPEMTLTGYEINGFAAEEAANLNIATIRQGTIIEPITDDNKYDLALSKTVLIHINPDELPSVYSNLYSLSKRFIMIVEYYNPTPVVVSYRGNEDKLFKRDFAGEMIDKYKMKLVDYGFVYHRDHSFPLDDMTWFLLEK